MNYKILFKIILLYFYFLQSCCSSNREQVPESSKYFFKDEHCISSCLICFNPFKMFFQDEQKVEIIRYYCNKNYVYDFADRLRRSLKLLALVTVSNPTLKTNQFVVTVFGSKINIEKIRNILEIIRGPI